MTTMTTSRPYLIRAIYDWISDNELTPYLVVDAAGEGVQVPEEHVEDGRITLNVSPLACRGLHLENDRIVFTARFGGIPKQIVATPKSVLAIYAKENGRGMVFGEDEDDASSPPPASAASGSKANGKGKPSLRVVK